MFKRLLLTTLVLLCAGPAFAAESATTDPAVSVDPALQELDWVTSRMTAYLRAIPIFRVETTTQWLLDGVQDRSGSARYELTVQHPNSFRLEIAAGSADQPSLLCTSDGKRLTRLYRSGTLAIFSRHDGGLEHVLEDALTGASLKGSGLDIVLRPDAHAYLMASVSDVRDCGDESLPHGRAHHFSAAWFGGSRIDFWISADHAPVLLRWRRTQKLDIGGQAHEMQVDSELHWKLDADLPPPATAIELPSDASEVQDLQAYLLKGGTDKLLGTPAPVVSLSLLDGSAWDLTRHRGAQPVVLFFFATWAAPSQQEMPALLKSVEEYEGRGVVFYAVAVGEKAEPVREFAAARQYTHPIVLDPEQQAAAAFRITSLPVTVLIGKDGTLQATHVGISQHERTLIHQDLEALLEGKLRQDAKR